MWVLTFHAACARLLRREAERIGYRPGFSIYDSADQVRVVKEVLETDLDKDPKRYPPRGLHARISDAKNRLVGPQEFRAQVNGFFDQTVADVYDRYQARLQQAGAMDFDDLLVNTVRLLEDVPDVREHWTRASGVVVQDPAAGPIETWSEVDDVRNGIVSYANHYRFDVGGEELVSRAALRFRALAEITQSLADAGFTVERVSGDWDGRPAGAHERELIVVASR